MHNWVDHVFCFGTNTGEWFAGEKREIIYLNRKKEKERRTEKWQAKLQLALLMAAWRCFLLIFSDPFLFMFHSFIFHGKWRFFCHKLVEKLDFPFQHTKCCKMYCMDFKCLFFFFLLRFDAYVFRPRMFFMPGFFRAA